MRWHYRGFTLVEALIALTVLSILLGVTVPAFRHLSANSKKLSAVQQVRSLLMLARATAVTHHQTTTACLSDDGHTCTSSGSRFLLIFVDKNGDHLADANEVMRQEPVVPGTAYTLSASSSNSLRFRPNGTAASYGSIVACASTDSRYGARLVVSSMGRLRSARDTDGDGIVEGADGQPLNCLP